MLADDDPQREELNRVFSDFHICLAKTAIERKWGREIHTPVILKLFDMIEVILPKILSEYEGAEREGKILGLAAQFRFTIEQVMPWKRFLEIANTKAMDDMARLMEEAKEVDKSVLDGFLHDNGLKEERRAQYIF